MLRGISVVLAVARWEKPWALQIHALSFCCIYIPFLYHSLYSAAWNLCCFGNRTLEKALDIEFNNLHPLYCCAFSPFSCILISWHVVVEEYYLPGVTKLVATARVAHDFC